MAAAGSGDQELFERIKALKKGTHREIPDPPPAQTVQSGRTKAAVPAREWLPRIQLTPHDRLSDRLKSLRDVEDKGEGRKGKRGGIRGDGGGREGGGVSSEDVNKTPTASRRNSSRTDAQEKLHTQASRSRKRDEEEKTHTANERGTVSSVMMTRSDERDELDAVLATDDATLASLLEVEREYFELCGEGGAGNGSRDEEDSEDSNGQEDDHRDDNDHEDGGDSEDEQHDGKTKFCNTVALQSNSGPSSFAPPASRRCRPAASPPSSSTSSTVSSTSQSSSSNTRPAAPSGQSSNVHASTESPSDADTLANLDARMAALLRPSLLGAQLSDSSDASEGSEEEEEEEEEEDDDDGNDEDEGEEGKDNDGDVEGCDPNKDRDSIVGDKHTSCDLCSRNAKVVCLDDCSQPGQSPMQFCMGCWHAVHETCEHRGLVLERGKRRRKLRRLKILGDWESDSRREGMAEERRMLVGAE